MKNFFLFSLIFIFFACNDTVQTKKDTKKITKANTQDLTALDTSVPMPPLMLQPRLENAVYHGIERLPEGGCITVAGGSDGQLAWLEVANPLPVHAPAPLHTGHQEALANIRERLSLLYGGRGSLQTTASTTGFTARLCWPFTGNR